MESTAPGWALTGIEGARKVTVQGWMAGWSIPAGGSFEVRYGPARIARLAFYLLPVTVVLSVAVMYAVRLPPGRPGDWQVRHRPPGVLRRLRSRLHRPRPRWRR